jgi:hypothetical protein
MGIVELILNFSYLALIQPGELYMESKIEIWMYILGLNNMVNWKNIKIAPWSYE